jgi:hypothetical protein
MTLVFIVYGSYIAFAYKRISRGHPIPSAKASRKLVLMVMQVGGYAVILGPLWLGASMRGSRPREGCAGR